MLTGGLRIGFGLGVSALQNQSHFGGPSGPAITASLLPSLSALTQGQTPNDGYGAGVYASSAGTITSIVASYLVNGVPEVASYSLSAGDMVQILVIVSDNAANSRQFTTATVTVAGTSASINITALRGHDQVAPEGIWFETSVSGFDVGGPAAGEIYDPRAHKIHYVWSFQDAGTFSAPVNLAPGLNDKNIAYGPKVSHVFETPGSYTVSVTAIDKSGTIAADTFNLTVRDGAVEFSGTKTIVVAQDGDFAGAPAGADHYTTFAAALGAYRGLPGSGRLLLKRGESYTIAANTKVDSSYRNFHLGAWGLGALPILDNTAGGIKTLWLKTSMTGGADRDFNIHDIRFLGGWDSTTETGTIGQWAMFLDAPAHVTVSGCEFDGLDISIYTHINATTLILNDSKITNWSEYGVFGDQAQNVTAGMTGMNIAQHVDALAGSTGKSTKANHHGPFRHSYKNLYVDCCDFFSKNGWSTNPGVNFTDQPCIRHNTRVTPDCYAYYSRISCEGGWIVVEMADSTGVTTDVSGNTIWDGCYLLGTAGSDMIMSIAYGGTTVRNVIMVQPNVPRLVNGFLRFINLTNDGIDAVNVAAPLDIYNVTFVNLLNDANDAGRPFAVFNTGSQGVFTNDTIENTVSHAPNLPASLTADAPLSAVLAFTPRYNGFRWRGDPVLNSAHATPANAVQLFQPLPGSAAIDDATAGQTARIDFQGNLRAAPPARGATEAS